MCLIITGIGAVGGVLTDHWKEFSCCESLNKHVLAVKEQKSERPLLNYKKQRQHRL